MDVPQPALPPIGFVFAGGRYLSCAVFGRWAVPVGFPRVLSLCVVSNGRYGSILGISFDIYSYCTNGTGTFLLGARLIRFIQSAVGRGAETLRGPNTVEDAARKSTITKSIRRCRGTD